MKFMTPGEAETKRQKAVEFLHRIGKAKRLIRPAVGIGEEVRLTGEGIAGAALWAEQRYIHMCAFTAHGDGAPAGFHTRMSRPAHRRAQ